MNNINVKKSLMWQDSESHIGSLIGYVQDFVNTNINFYLANQYKNTVNFLTADSFGLIVWANILGIEGLSLSSGDYIIPFGYGSYRKNYYSSNYYTNMTTTVSSTQLLTLIKLKYSLMTRSLTIPNISTILDFVWGSGNYTITIDSSTKTITIEITSLTSTLLDYIKDNNLVPVPAGISYSFNSITG